MTRDENGKHLQPISNVTKSIHIFKNIYIYIFGGGWSIKMGRETAFHTDYRLKVVRWMNSIFYLSDEEKKKM